MNDTRGPAHLGKEERLAARLRENLRRRKAQARAMTEAMNEDAAGEALPKPGESG